jgi:uncharacterized protein YjlB
VPDKTKIFLSSGHEVVVEEQPSEVTDRLTRPEAFHQFKGNNGRDVYVADGQVAYLEQVAGAGEISSDADFLAGGRQSPSRIE